MLDVIGTMAGLAAILMNAVAMAAVLPLSVPRKLLLGAGAGLWVGLATYLAQTGQLAVSPQNPVPLIGVLFAAPLLAAFISWRLLPGFRSALMAIPLPLLIGLNGMRVLGVLFLFLAVAGRLSGPFPYSAGIGDIITGALAVPLALAAARGTRDLHTSIARWNAFGALDLIAAVTLGVGSAQGAPTQFIHAGIGSAAVQHLPYALIPTVLVPFYLITHALVAAQLRVARDRRNHGGEPSLSSRATHGLAPR